MKNQSPPIVVWIWVIGLTLFLFLLIHVPFIRSEIKYRSVRYFFNVSRISNIREVNEYEKNNDLIIAVGSSLSASGLNYDNHMDNLASELGYPNIKFVRFTRLVYSTLDQFIPLLEPILKARPKYVFFEARPFLLYLNIKEDYLIEEREMIKYPFRYILNLFFTLPQENWSYADNSKEVNILHMKETVDLLTDTLAYKQFLKDYTINNNPLPQKFVDFLTSAKKNGIKVFLLDLPRSDLAFSFIPHQLREGLPSLLDKYKNNYNLKLVSFPYRLPLKYYRDMAHLNTSGSKLYSKWFIKMIDSLNNQEKHL